MPNLKAIDPSVATGKTKELLDFVEQRSNRIPNMVRLMANSPAALAGYLNFALALKDAALPSRIRDLIGVAVAQAIGSDYTVAATVAIARPSGLSEQELAAARRGQSDDPKTSAALLFATKLIDQRGQLRHSEISNVKDAGYSDGEIAEIIATVSLNMYRSYFNLIAQPETDFPVPPAA